MLADIFLLTFVQTDQGAASREMTPAGWAFMAIAWAIIIFTTVWTFGKILRKK